jgi:hypothetical protein
MAYIWVFVLGVTVWIINLIVKSYELQDAFDASLGISIVAIPVFLSLAVILTYVFVGLQRGREPVDPYHRIMDEARNQEFESHSG